MTLICHSLRNVVIFKLAITLYHTEEYTTMVHHSHSSSHCRNASTSFDRSSMTTVYYVESFFISLRIEVHIRHAVHIGWKEEARKRRVERQMFKYLTAERGISPLMPRLFSIHGMLISCNFQGLIMQMYEPLIKTDTRCVLSSGNCKNVPFLPPLLASHQISLSFHACLKF